MLKFHNILLNQIDTLVHERQLLKTERNYSLFLYEYNLLFTTIFLETELGYLFKDAAYPNSMFLAHLCNKPPNSISFFIDGSKDEESGRVGAAYSPDLNTFSLLGLHSYFSVFSAECIALQNAIRMALESSYDNVFIYLDSLSALQALIKSSVTIKTNPFILDIRRLINLYSSANKNLYFYWIPSHIGITFNEKADSSAKEYSFKTQAKIETERQIILESEFKGTKFLKSRPSKPWFSRTKLPRDFICWTNKLRADYIQLAAFLFKINLALDTKYKCGNVVQDLNHII